MSLLAFGLVLRPHGWRILFLGADSRLSTIQETARMDAPAVNVPVTFDTALVETEGTALSRLARIAPLYLSGPGASPDLTGQLRVRRLDGDPIDPPTRWQ
jgi:MerR family transcriptional regulator, light-induced transcriptional regulator